jgi:hypothetical protein
LTTKQTAHPISAEEIEVSLKSIFSRTDLLEKFLPTNSQDTSPALLNSLYDAAKAVLSDSALTESLRLQLNLSGSESITSSELESSSLDPCSLWEGLKARYQCVICQDVLACPTIVGHCSHTFCYECIENYIQSCISLDSEVTVMKKCPICRSTIVHKTYEPLLHHEIEMAVVSVPGHENQKKDWAARCERYFEMKRRQQLKESSVISRCNNGSDPSVNDDNSEMKIALAIAAAALVLILVVRSM